MCFIAVAFSCDIVKFIFIRFFYKIKLLLYKFFSLIQANIIHSWRTCDLHSLGWCVAAGTSTCPAPSGSAASVAPLTHLEPIPAACRPHSLGTQPSRPSSPCWPRQGLHEYDATANNAEELHFIGLHSYNKICWVRCAMSKVLTNVWYVGHLVCIVCWLVASRGKCTWMIPNTLGNTCTKKKQMHIQPSDHSPVVAAVMNTAAA